MQPANQANRGRGGGGRGGGGWREASDRGGNGRDYGTRNSNSGERGGSERGSNSYRGGRAGYNRGGGGGNWNRCRVNKYPQAPANSKLAVNFFGLKLSDRKIYRHVVEIKLFDHEKKKDFILSTISARSRGNRASKQKDNFILVEKLLEGLNGKNKFAYDGAQLLFAMDEIDKTMTIPVEAALEIEGISDYLKDSIKYLNGDLEISIKPDAENPSFSQTDHGEWDAKFYAYLDIVTSQGARRSGIYLSQSKGVYVNININDMTKHPKAAWIQVAKGVHKGCRIIGTTEPLPILELDPLTARFYAPVPLSELIRLAFPKEVSTNQFVKPTQKLKFQMKLLLKGLKCNRYYTDLQDWTTNNVTVTDIDFMASKNNDFRKVYNNLKWSKYPAAVCGMGAHAKLIPLEYLRVIPYQSLDRTVLKEFELTPCADEPSVRWASTQNHFNALGFNDVIMKAFGITLSNDPFQNVSKIDGERVIAPKVAYAEEVRVDHWKRDWNRDDQKFVQPATIHRFVVVFIKAYSEKWFQSDVTKVEFIKNALIQRCEEKGMRIENSELKTFQGEQNSEKFLCDVIKNVLEHSKDSSFMPFVLLVSDNIPGIHELLKIEERMNDIPTQHILLNTINNMKKKLESGQWDQTLDNIVLKLNIKCGGLNYTADVPADLKCWRDCATFVMGMDVAHPNMRDKRDGFPSTVGLSCNSADHPYTFIGDFHYTEPKQEVISPEILQKFTKQNILKFSELRGFPEKIIIFRDGVSFGEESAALEEVQIIERTVIEAAISMGHKDYAPKILAIVVKKRHHTRFYADGGEQGKTNPLPDTSMGGEIAEYGKRQVFIQAFRAIQGTAKVPSFLIIRDDESVPDAQITKMVCAVCSLHQIVNSPTSIPTPVFVAHELAKRGTNLIKAYIARGETFGCNWSELTEKLSYSSLERLSKIRFV